jgi:hypothetical protein
VYSRTSSRSLWDDKIPQRLRAKANLVKRVDAFAWHTYLARSWEMLP